MTPLLLVIVVSLAAGIPSLLMGLLIGRRQRQQQVVELTTELHQQAQVTIRMSRLASEERKSKNDTVEAIAIIEKERDKWKDMYFKASIGHGNAQAMLMRELGRLSNLCQRNNLKNANVSADVRKVVAEFTQEFVAQNGTEKGEGIAGGSQVAKPAPTV